MTLRICPCCKKMLTTRNVKNIGRSDLGGGEQLYITCNDCHSTCVLMNKRKKAVA